MSDQALEQLSETLQYLQYPHPIPANSFRTPNFELMASVLVWNVQRLDPTIAIHDKIGTDDGRALFLNGIASGLCKMNLLLDTKNLLAADRYAVKELLKVANVLYEASTLANEVSSSEEEFEPEATLNATTKARSLIVEITEISARLHGLLQNESEDSTERSKALSYLNSASDTGGDGSKKDHVESCVGRILESTNAAVERLDKQCKILISNKRGMEEKIRKKTIDLERTSKRLESLKHVRPAYMDEYEQLEEELQVEYERYVVRLRNVDYLDGELVSFKQEALDRQSKTERAMKRMQKKFREEELKILNGGDSYNSGAVSMRAGENATSSVTPMQSEGRDNLIRISVDEVLRKDASSATSTPRDHTSFSRSEGSSSTPSSGGSGRSFDGSEMTGSLLVDDGDSDDYF